MKYILKNYNYFTREAKTEDKMDQYVANYNNGVVDRKCGYKADKNAIKESKKGNLKAIAYIDGFHGVIPQNYQEMESNERTSQSQLSIDY
jgi:hypothetical protein